MLEEGGDGCIDVDSLVFLSAGCESFGGRPGPRFVPVVGEAACAIVLVVFSRQFQILRSTRRLHE